MFKFFLGIMLGFVGGFWFSEWYLGEPVEEEEQLSSGDDITRKAKIIWTIEDGLVG